MKNKPALLLPVILSAYAVYPLPSSAEGVVNGALIDALREHSRVALVTSSFGYRSFRDPGLLLADSVCVYAVGRESWGGNALERLSNWLAYPKMHPLGAGARLVDRLRTRFWQAPPLRASAWSQRAAAQILAWLEGGWHDGVVWVRGTPPESFEAAILAYRRRPFPLVVNYNDPMPRCLQWGERYSRENPDYDAWQHRQNAFLAHHAQAWTFPSRRLAERMAEAAGLELNRCFVIPHLTPDQPLPPPVPVLPGPWLLYAGTLYSTVFTDPIRAGLADYAQSGGQLRLLFALKHPSAEDRRWLTQQVPGCMVLADISPMEVAGLSAQARAVLVVDSPGAAMLLRVKVVEAVRSGKPILAFASPDSTTAEVIGRSGGLVFPAVDTKSVVAGLRTLEQALVPETGQGPDAKRSSVAARFSMEQIIPDSLAVLEYARQRFIWHEHGVGVEPVPPSIERWP